MASSNKRPRVLGEAPPGIYKARTDDGKPADPGHAIFPIVTQRPDGTFELIGTGFFIGPQGLFATAAHNISAVLDSAGAPTRPFGIFQFFPNNTYHVRPIQRATRHKVADIAVGIPYPMNHNVTGDPAPNKTLALAKKPPKVGSAVASYAYPLTTIQSGKPQIVRFEPRFFEGFLTEHLPDGRDKVMLPGPCFQTSMAVHGGASGGPVIDTDGNVFAVNSTGYENDTLSFVSCISKIFELELPGFALPGDSEPRTVSIGELHERGYISAR